MYNITNLTQIADCNALLAWAAKEKADLNYRKLSDERLTVRFAETSQEIEAILQGVIAEIAAQETIIAVLPDGPTKQEAINKKVRLEYKQFVLENRRESYGTITFLEKQMELERVNREIEEVDVFITTITNHRDSIVTT